jgi:hypothetical protein
MRFPNQFAGVLAVAFVVLASDAAGQDFRVETDVYLGGKKQPESQHLTLFSGHLVYVFTLAGKDDNGRQEITILDTSKGSKGRVILLDVNRRQRAELTTADLLDFTAKIKKLARGNKKRGFLDPDFEVTFDKEQQTLELSSSKITYRATGIEPKQPDAVNRYREFADWYARLNAMRPGNIPPFARLELNRALAAKGLLPEEIVRTLRLGRVLPDKQEARSKQLIHWQLSNTDRRRIRDVAGFQSGFLRVSLQKYFQLEDIAKK